jgi:uncharacterized protein (AIM24 family)
MHDQLLGTTQPVLSVALEPGEGVIGLAGEFAWMTDSIQMTTAADGLSAYAAQEYAGTIAFASRRPGRIVALDIAAGQHYLIHQDGFLAGTPGIELTAGDDCVLRRIGGTGRVWIELSGEVFRRELTAGTSLRTHPWHIGICDATVAVQMAAVTEPARDRAGADVRLLAVLSGPGSVWLQSTPRCVPAVEGAAGPHVASLPHAPSDYDRGSHEHEELRT